MKKQFTFLCLTLLLSLSAWAQVTITNASVPTPGMLPRFSLADSVSSVGADFMSTGPNSTWDFSYLEPAFQRVDTFVNVPVNYVLSFGGATVARKIPLGDGSFAPPGGGAVTITNAYQMYKKSSSKYENMGFGGTANGLFPLSLVNSPTDVVYNFPLNYNDKDTSYSEAELNVQGFVYVNQRQNRINHADGWGQVITPYKTFDALRVKSILTGHDSIIYSGFTISQPRVPQTEYKWLSTNEKVPVLTISTRAFAGPPEVTNVLYRDTVQDVPYVGIAPTPAPINASIYPNPTSEIATLVWEEQLGKNGVMEIYNLNGQIVHTQSLLVGGFLSFDVSSYPAGMYKVILKGDKKSFEGSLLVKRSQ